MKIPPRRVRTIQRNAHLLAAAILFAYLYGPLGTIPTFDLIVRGIIIPALTVTGVLMWQMPRIRKVLRKRTDPPAATSV